MFKLCIEKLTLPDGLKIAQKVLIYKGGDKNKSTNYRIISFISNITKVSEEIIYCLICNFITEYKIISDKQIGFIKGKETKEA